MARARKVLRGARNRDLVPRRFGFGRFAFLLFTAINGETLNARRQEN